jgi:hypothetical protein
MKKLILAFLHFLLIAQLPMNATKFIQSEWMKSFQYGLKWTELMMNGYPGTAEASGEPVPEGTVTTTVMMASAIAGPAEIDFHLPAICDEELSQQVVRFKVSREKWEIEKAARIQVELQRFRLSEIKTVRVVHM